MPVSDTISKISLTLRTISGLATFLRSRPKATFWYAVRCGKSAYDWNTMFTSRLFGVTPVTSLPSRNTVPAVGSSNPAIIRIVVVLPHPDGPSSEKNSPCPIARSICCTAGTRSPCDRYSLRTPTSSMALSVICTSSAESTHHVFDAGVLLEAVHREVLAVAGVAEAAVRHLGHERQVGVDPHRAEVEAPGHPHGAAVVARPDAGAQAVPDVVGPAGGGVLVGELLNGDDRAEDLVLDHLVVLPEAGPRGGLEEVAAVADAPAAGDHLGVVRRAVQ